MTDQDQRPDEELGEVFGRLRARDGETLPSFAAMMARARDGAGEEAADQQGHDALSPEVRPTPAGNPLPERAPAVGPTPLRLRRGGQMRWISSLVAAAVVAALLISGRGREDREFDRLVDDWSRTAQVALQSPTDRLLAVPGSQYLRSVPQVGSGLPTSSPSPGRRP